MKVSLALALLASFQQASAFAPTPLGAQRQVASPQLRGLAALPTVEQVSSGDFMSQLGFASQIMPVLHPSEGAEVSEEDSEQLPAVLAGQLTHADGIRGFFACYFTFLVTSTADGSMDIPDALADAVKSADPKVLAPMACTNAIMPAAMVSVHQDESLISLSAKTAANGKKILSLLKGDDVVTSNCRAILSVCEDSEEGEADLIKHWKEFFDNSKFEDPQKKAIAEVAVQFC